MSLDSRWLVRQHGAFQDANHLYLVMDYMQSGSLEDLLFRHLDVDDSKGLPEDVVRWYAAQVALALEELHNFGFVHR